MKNGRQELNKINMITRKEAIEQYKRNGEEGWINLLEMVFDGKPESIEITNVWPKYAEM